MHSWQDCQKSPVRKRAIPFKTHQQDNGYFPARCGSGSLGPVSLAFGEAEGMTRDKFRASALAVSEIG